MQVQFLPGAPKTVKCYHLFMKQKSHVETMKKYRNSPRKKAIMRDVLPNALIVFGVMFLVMAYGPIVTDEVWYRLKTLRHQQFFLNKDKESNDSVFARFVTGENVNLVPVNNDFSIIIEEIGVNAPIVKDVSVTNESAYFEALHNGVAHASTSPYPSENPGNVYLFAHSAVNFWDLGKYAKVFNLLRKVEVGDPIHVFYEGKDYKYEVVNKEIYDGWDTYPITRTVIEPTLTLQTCDPPGTTLNRLVVTSKLVSVN